MNDANPNFWIGVVEDRFDPLKLGRVRVRIMGIHTHDKTMLPTADLPWAYKVQPTTSGAISGIGLAPIGVMEGTWVTIQFIDPDKQMPFVVGSLGGVVHNMTTYIGSDDQSGSYDVNGNGEIEPTPAPPPPPEIERQIEKTGLFNPPSTYTASAAIIAFIKQKEAFRSRPYQDAAGVWTIGYGTTTINGRPVNASTPSITDPQAVALLTNRIKEVEEPAIVRNCRTPITQSMFDAMVSFTYNVGIGAFARSSVVTNLNARDYTTAAQCMLQYNKAKDPKSGKLVVLNGLTDRRIAERDWFLRDGVIDEAGNFTDTPGSIAKDEANGTYPTLPQFAPSDNNGFKDSNQQYPKPTAIYEPDTNRLARGDKIRNTVVYLKELGEHKGVPKANGKGTWDQSKTPYAAEYPYNNVWQSESGHIFEFDDTPKSERVHLYHRSGTFLEIDHNGTQVNKVVGDGYLVYERDGYIHVAGNCDVYIEGAKTVRVDNALDLEVHGTTTINIHNDANINVAGDAKMSVGGDYRVKVAGDYSVKVDGNYSVNVARDYRVNVAGGFSVDAKRIDLNSGKAGKVVDLKTIKKSEPVEASSTPLTVRTRGEKASTKYESPDDGTPADFEAYKKQRIEEGSATREELEAAPKTSDTTSPPKNNVAEKPNVCGVQQGKKDFAVSDRLSKYYTVGDLTNRGQRKIVDRLGLRADEIYCNLKALCENVLDTIKEKYPNVKINSGLREENTRSQHNVGQAVDISFPDLSRAQLYDRVIEIQKLIPYDQLILEYNTPGGNGWIHISYKAGACRRQHFTMNNHRMVGGYGQFTRVA